MNRIVFYLLVSFFGVTDIIAQKKMLMEESDGFKWYIIWTDDDKFSGALDVYGNDIIPLYKYRYVCYSDGVFMVVNNEEDLHNVKWGYYTRKGQLIASPDSYDTCLKLEQHGNKFIKVSKGGLYGILSLDGKWIVPLKYDTSDFYSWSKQEGLYLYYYHVEKDGLCGAYDLSGKLIVPLKYKSLRYRDWDDDYQGFEGIDLNGSEYKKLNIKVPLTYSLTTIMDLFSEAYNTSDADKKRDLYSKIITYDPYNLAGVKSYAYNNLGLLYEKNNDIKTAKRCYQMAIEIDANNNVAKENLTNIKKTIRNNNIDNALNMFGYMAQVLNSMNSNVSTNDGQGTWNNGVASVESSGGSSYNSSSNNSSNSKKVNSQLVMSLSRSYDDYESQLARMKSSGNYSIDEVRSIQKKMKEVRERYNKESGRSRSISSYETWNP